MNKKISFFSNKLTIFSLASSLLFIYFLNANKYFYVYFFLYMISMLTLSFINTIYVYNMKSSLLEAMNIKRKKIYGTLYLWGFLSYLPMFIVLVIYSLFYCVTFKFIGIIIIINEMINMRFVVKNCNIRNVMITYTASLASLTFLYLLGLTKVLNG